MTADYAPRNYAGNAVKTNLTGGMTNADTTVAIADATGWPLSAFWMLLDAGTTSEELVYVATRAGLSLSGIVRNVTSGGAFAHAAGGVRTCWPCGAAQDFQEANAVTSALTTKGDLLVKGSTLAVAPARLAVGANLQVLQAAGGPALGLQYADVALGRIVNANSTTDQTGITSALTDITFATATWTAVVGRLYKVTLIAHLLQVTTFGGQLLEIQTGASGAGTALVHSIDATNTRTAGSWNPITTWATYVTGSGSTSVHARASTTGGTLTINNATYKGWFIVEDVGLA